MTDHVLIPTCWTFWGILSLGWLAVAIKVFSERTHHPDIGRGAGWVVVLLAIVQGLVAGLIYWFTASESHTGLTVMTIALAYPALALLASPAIVVCTAWKRNRVRSRIGDFRHPALRAMAAAIRDDDVVKLEALLAGKPPVEGKDLAGHDFLTYALLAVCDEKKRPEIARLVLEAGADPRKAFMPDGLHVIHYLIVSSSPGAHQAVRLLLRYGADPNAVSIFSGDTPLREASGDVDTVRALVEHGAEIDRLQSDGLPALANFVARRDWEAAICLVEEGAALDFRNEAGYSLDSFLDEWRRGTYGPPPEGFEKFSRAVAARRKRGR